MVDTYRKNIRLIDILQDLLSRGLQSWVQESANGDNFAGMYAYIEHSIMALFEKATFNMSEMAKRWMAQQLFMSIKFKPAGAIEMPDGSHLQSPPKAFDNEVDIKMIPGDDLRMLGSLLSDCDFAPKIAAELRRRG